MRPKSNSLDKKTVKWFGAFIVLCLVFAIGVMFGRGNYGLKINQQSSTNYDVEQIAQDLPEDLNYDQVEEIYDVIRKNYDGQLNESELMDGLKRGLALATGDPYTEFFDKDAAGDFQDSLDGTFTGIGAELGLEGTSIVVVTPLSGYPAESAGLRPQDVIVLIDDEDATGLTITEAVNKIRGEAGADVTLTIVRNQSEILEITITRAVIDIPSVTYKIENGIGILEVSRFSDDTTDLANKAADAFLEANVKGVVLDLRGNPGGFLDEAVTLSGIWLDQTKSVVDIRRGGVSQQTMYARGSKKLMDIKTVVLINQGSASASEIVAGALQDHEVATVVGKTSYGKGSVQNLEEVGIDELLKVTTARWFTPNGNSIDHSGIIPDEEVEITQENIDNSVDPQLDRAKALLGV